MTAEQLRNSILQEAISGRLVPQDPNDEPASVLLQRIREEKARLVKEGKLKKKDLAETPITAEEIPFEIPASWEWCRIHEISQSYIGLTYSPADVSEDGIIVLRSSNIKSGKLTLNDIVRVKKEINEKLQVALNDIIICARNGSRKLVGKSALITEMSEPMTFGAFMAICKTPFYSFVYQFLQSNLFFSQLRKVSDTTTINQLTQNNFNSFLIPLPPLAEQKRIVAKLEELLPIVEQYGKAQKELDELNAALPARLRQSILQEAISGRLVPQDPNDEPASVLLARIREEKARLVKDGKLKKKDLVETPITDDEKPFEIPDSWEWVRLNSICDKIVDGDHNPPQGLSEQTEYLMISSRNINNNKLVNLDCVRYLSKEVFDIENLRTTLTEGDILFTSVGSLGRSCVYLGGRNLCFQRSVSIIHTLVYNYWLKYFFDSNYYQSFVIEKSTGTAQVGFYLNQLSKSLIAVPPLAEQQRIVAKIEELFTEIDKMK